MSNLLSLFDYSGTWSDPYLQDGWNVFNWDTKLDISRNIKALDSVETCLDVLESVDGILAAPPCTDFAVSGAQYWTAKDLAGITAQSISLIHQLEKLLDLFTPTDPDFEGTWFWCMENPVGRLQKLFPYLDKPMYIHPWEYAGWLNLTDHDHNTLDKIRCKDGKGVTREEVEIVISLEAYTKKTGLWGYFNHSLEKRPIEPVRVCPQGSPLQTFGGKSALTKEKRSNTPRGFSRAFYEANKNHAFDYESAHSTL